ncbi:papain-like cysteine protease family protein [Kitasatospora sp. NPDC058965]|uniref:papain-like cysteine protease family protein n=1 Tax=Kitasatospora sp. NPDC058965 TaxID=3346682 RepID=UPI003682FFC5
MSAPGTPGARAGRLRRALAVAALATLAPALTAATSTPAAAATAPTVRTADRTAVPNTAAPHAATAGSTWRTLNISMQQQQNTNWCWAASGDTIAGYYGYSYTQNQFCNAAFGRSIDSSCPNSQASLDNVQSALSWIGINPGSYVNGYLYYSTVQGEIDANRPVETRIQWSSGGGHMEVLYGYDVSNNWVYWGDPWPSDYRYNWADYWYYVSNNSFSWTHSLYRIGA